MAMPIYDGNDALIDTGYSLWRIANAKTNTWNGALAIGAGLTSWSGQRVDNLSIDVEKDATTLAFLNTMRQSNSWSNSAAPPAAVNFNNQAELAHGFRALARTGLYSGPYDYAMVQFHSPSNGGLIWLDAPLNDVRNYPGAWPAGQNSISGPFPGSSPWNKRLYTTTDGVKFIVDPADGKGYKIVDRQDAQLLPGPSQAQFDAWKAAAPEAARKLTESSQTKQAFLQDLITDLNKFFNWTTNIMQRMERDKDAIVARF
jgi:hypothetical protein